MKYDDINFFYNYYLNRNVDPEGLQFYEKVEDGSNEIEWNLLGSDEFKKNTNILNFPNARLSRKICILPEAKMIFVPIAKNAHTSITEAFIEARGIDWKKLPITESLVKTYGDAEDRFHSAIETNNTGVLLKDLSPKIVHEAFSSPDYIRVAVVRDPIKRIISAYNHLLVESIMKPVVMRYTEDIRSFFDKKPEDSVSFEEFVKYLKCTPIHKQDLHFTPQYTYLDSFKIDKLIPIERLDVLAELYKSRSNMELNIKTMNCRSKKQNSGVDNFSVGLKIILEEMFWMDKKLYIEACSCN